MKEYNIEILKDAANRLLFDMSNDEYATLLNEFDIVIKQMEAIGLDNSLDNFEPMIFPFECTTTFLREDIAGTPLERETALKNSKRKIGGQIKLPKVVL